MENPTTVGEQNGATGSTAVFVVELQRYSRTIEALGATAVDRIRTEVTRRIHEVVPVRGSVARIGSDEIAVVIDGVGPRYARDAAERLRAALREEVEIPGGGVRYSVHVAVVLVEPEPTAGLSDEIVTRARSALQEARGVPEGIRIVELDESA